MRSPALAFTMVASGLLAGCVTAVDPVPVMDAQAIHVAVPPLVPGGPTTHSQVQLLYTVVAGVAGEAPLQTAQKKAETTCGGRYGSEYIVRSVAVNGRWLEIYFYCLTSSVPVGTTLPAPPAVTVVRPTPTG